MKRMNLIYLLLGLLMAACSKDDNNTTPVASSDQLYASAIADATVADSSEMVDSLWSLTANTAGVQWKTIDGQQYVLMATFMRYPSSYPEGQTISNTWGEAWLFIPGQMKSRIGASFNAKSDTIMRICELLGLPPVNANSNTHISQVWVPVSALYRPAGNPDVTTKTAGPVLISSVTADYTTWFNNYIIYAYYHPLTSGTDFHYPWTRLGYTYDWAPGSKHVGLSEYVLPKASTMVVEKTSTAADFFRN
jgi:hypothetical protein